MAAINVTERRRPGDTDERFIKRFMRKVHKQGILKLHIERTTNPFWRKEKKKRKNRSRNKDLVNKKSY